MDDEKAMTDEKTTGDEITDGKTTGGEITDDKEQNEELVKALEQETESSVSEEEETFVRPDYESEIIQIIRSTTSPKITREKLEDYHANDIADVLEKLTVVERRKLYNMLNMDMLSDVFECLDDIGPYLDEMDIRKAVEIISNLEADTAVAALRGIEKTKRSVIIDLMDQESKKDIMLIASFDDDEIGSRMTTNYIVIRENLTIKGAMRSLVEQAAENDNISKIYVADESNTFCGAIDLKDLIIAREGTKLDDVIVTSYPYVYGHESIDDCIEILKGYSEDSIPVLDNNNKILGVITAQNIIEVVDEEMGEDYARLAGLTAEEDLKEPILASMKKRLPWLIVLMFLGMLVSSVVGIFESVVSQLTILMTFQSMILGMSGNAGTQSLAVTVRVLMDENLVFKQKLGLAIKEVRVGFGDGLLLGVLSFVLLGVFIMIAKGRPAGFAFAVSGCIGLALMCSMIISSLTGTVIPMLFNKVGIDPAVASGPLITTVNDLVAVVVYYGLSWLFLLEMMHLG